ncbi:MAG: hypothetical protein AABX19_01865 [Nanoarchaeota archaeon]
MKRVLVLILVLGILLTACVSEKKQVEQLHTATLNAILLGDAKTSAAAFSENYIDIGDGAKKPMNDESFTSLFNSEIYKTQIQGKKVEDLFDLSKKEIYTFNELKNTKYKDFGKGSFELKQGDIFAYYPNKFGAVLSDGFIGIYRKENGNWKIVAGD